MASSTAIARPWLLPARVCMSRQRAFLIAPFSSSTSSLFENRRPPKKPAKLSKYAVKELDAEKRWAEKAERIDKGEEQCLWDIFEERGYVKDATGTPGAIRELMKRKRIGAYVGIDPTGPSMHLGHLLPLMPLFWMYMHGYSTVSLIGGSTAKIGDPTGRLKDREKIHSDKMAKNMLSIHYQLKRIWVNVEAQARRYGYQDDWAARRAIKNNNHWWNKLPMLQFLQLLGSHMRLGPMLSRDTVKRKMGDGDGMSFAELTYPLMQGWDWWELYKQVGVQMQIGGSDQFGNIVAGVEAVKTVRQGFGQGTKFSEGPDHDPVGFTVPLLTNSAGEKIGKSTGGGSLWLDQMMTSPYDLYGHFMRLPDGDLERHLKLFTFMPTAEIRTVMEAHAADPPKREAHHRLALEVLRLVHGHEVADHTQHEHKTLHGRSAEPVKFTHAAETHPVLNSTASMFHMKLPASLISKGNIARILYAAGLASSVSHGNRLAFQKAAYIGGRVGGKDRNGGRAIGDQIDWRQVALWFPEDTAKYIIDEKLLLLRKGKHEIRCIEIVSDEEWEASGDVYPGQPYVGKLRMAKAAMENVSDLRQRLEDDEEEDAWGDGREDGGKYRE